MRRHAMGMIGRCSPSVGGQPPAKPVSGRTQDAFNGSPPSQAAPYDSRMRRRDRNWRPKPDCLAPSCPLHARGSAGRVKSRITASATDLLLRQLVAIRSERLTESIAGPTTGRILMACTAGLPRRCGIGRRRGCLFRSGDCQHAADCQRRDSDTQESKTHVSSPLMKLT